MIKQNFLIAGAGMAGLLAAQMLRNRHNVLVIEAQESLPNNHHAVLRFRSKVVSEVTGIPFKKVRMLKDYIGGNNPVAASLAYSYKCTGVYRSDRSLPAKLEEGDRYIAPSDFISRLSQDLDIRFSLPLGLDLIKSSHGDNWNIISTIPMPALASMILASPRLELPSISGYVATLTVPDCDAYCTLYDARSDSLFSRLSVTGDQVILESPEPKSEVASELLSKGYLIQDINEALSQLGLMHRVKSSEEFTWKPQRYAKILPATDDDARQRFIHLATDKHGVYSLGRFATWRPGLLLDDLVQDIQKIERWATKSHLYSVHKERW